MVLAGSSRRILRGLVPKALHSHRILRRQVLAKASQRVMSGPFRGMEYIDSSFGSEYFPKLLGTYEKELAPLVESLLEKPFERIVVAGAAEGYYAVGLARKTKTAIHAFEAHPEARIALHELAEKNGVSDRINIEGICDAAGLRKSMSEAHSIFILMDIEGAESILLDPAVVPELTSADILVELHELSVPGVTELVAKRFEQTHTMREIPSLPRHFADFPIPMTGNRKRFFKGAALQMMQEGRPAGMSWLVMTPRRGSL